MTPGPIFWAAQGLAAVAFIVMFASNYSIDRRFTVAGRGVSSLFFTVEYLLLGMWSAAGVAGLNAVRGFSMVGAATLRARRGLALLFITLHAGLFLFITGTLDSWVGWLPLARATVSTVAFSVEKVPRIKALTVLGSTIWILYFTITGLWVNVAGDSIAMGLAAVAWRRARRVEATLH